MATLFYQTKNNAKTTITNNPLTAGGLSITLASSTGSKFPTTGNTWLGTIWDAVTYSDPSDDPNMEIVLIDSRSTDTLTVNASGRGFAGTTGVSHATGSAFRLLFLKEHADQWSTAINALETARANDVAWTAWTPTLNCLGSMTIGSTTVTKARYYQSGKTVFFQVAFFGSTGGSASAGIGFTMPVAFADGGTTDTNTCSGLVYITGASTLIGAVGRTAGSNVMYVYRGDNTNYTTGAEWRVDMSGFYEVA